MRPTFDSTSQGVKSLVIDSETMSLARMLARFFSRCVLKRPKDATKKPIVILPSAAA
jgi:hypothetical protein